jgi:hypothetical protein
LRNDPENASENDQVILIFTWEDDDNGFSTWIRSPFWSVFSENYDYSEGYSVWTNERIRTQLFNQNTGQLAVVVYSFTDDHEVLIYDVHVPTCDAGAPAGACTNVSDCPAVDAGATDLLSAVCAACYSELDACSASNCAGTCPGQGGNACMHCEIDAGCHTQFMDCAGLDFMPLDSLTFPSPG